MSGITSWYLNPPNNTYVILPNDIALSDFGYSFSTSTPLVQDVAQNFLPSGSGLVYVEVSLNADVTDLWLGLIDISTAPTHALFTTAISPLFMGLNISVGTLNYTPSPTIAGTGTSMGSFTGPAVVELAFNFNTKEFWGRVQGGNWNGSGTANPGTDTGGSSFASLTGPFALTVLTGSTTTGNPTVVINKNTIPFEHQPTGFGGWPAIGTTPQPLYNPAAAEVIKQVQYVVETPLNAVSKHQQLVVRKPIEALSKQVQLVLESPIQAVSKQVQYLVVRRLPVSPTHIMIIT